MGRVLLGLDAGRSLLSDVDSAYLSADVTRILFWCALVLWAVVELVTSLVAFPPPVRKWPDKRPFGGLLPWCCLGRLLGYGLIEWHSGTLTPFKAYFLERHDVVAIFTGNFKEIPQASRILMLVSLNAAAFSLSLVLTNEDGEVEGSWFEKKIWVYVAIFVQMLVHRISLRLAALGLHVVDKDHWYAYWQAGSITIYLVLGFVFAHLIATRACDVQCTGANYMWTFGSNFLWTYTITLPMQMTATYAIGWFLYSHSKDYWTADMLGAHSIVVARWKTKLNKAKQLQEANARAATESAPPEARLEAAQPEPPMTKDGDPTEAEAPIEEFTGVLP